MCSAPEPAPASVASVPAGEVTPDTEETADATAAESSGEPEVNPDDMVWEVKPLANTSEGTNESGIKRIDVTGVLGKGPPPLERR